MALKKIKITKQTHLIHLGFPIADLRFWPQMNRSNTDENETETGRMPILRILGGKWLLKKIKITKQTHLIHLGFPIADLRFWPQMNRSNTDENETETGRMPILRILGGKWLLKKIKITKQTHLIHLGFPIADLRFWPQMNRSNTDENETETGRMPILRILGGEWLFKKLRLRNKPILSIWDFRLLICDFGHR